MTIDIPATLDLDIFIPTMPLPRNGHSNRWALAEMLLKSTYISEKDNTVCSPFTRVDSKARWGKPFLQLYGKDPESMLCAAKATVKKVTGLMEGHDITQMGIDDTSLGDWIANQANMKDQGQPEAGAEAMKQKQMENATRREQDSGKREDLQQGEKGQR